MDTGGISETSDSVISGSLSSWSPCLSPTTAENLWALQKARLQDTLFPCSDHLIRDLQRLLMSWESCSEL